MAEIEAQAHKDADIGPELASTVDMCENCPRLDYCLETSTEAYKEQVAKCYAIRHEVCAVCGLKRQDVTDEDRAQHHVRWAWRHGKHYCPACYAALPPLMTDPGEQPAGELRQDDDRHDKKTDKKKNKSRKR